MGHGYGPCIKWRGTFGFAPAYGAGQEFWLNWDGVYDITEMILLRNDTMGAWQASTLPFASVPLEILIHPREGALTLFRAQTFFLMPLLVLNLTSAQN